MFTGIVQACCDVVSIERHKGLLGLSFCLPTHLRHDVNIGASIAVNGVCLTVKTVDEDTGLVSFDVMQETLDLTNINDLSDDSKVNVERSVRFDTEVGGHCVSGHIDGAMVVERVDISENNKKIVFRYPPELTRYLFHKGFVAINGCSLTIAEKDDKANEIAVCYIPETLQKTNHGLLKKGDKVNLEIDRQTQAIVDTVERVLALKGFS